MCLPTLQCSDLIYRAVSRPSQIHEHGRLLRDAFHRRPNKDEAGVSVRFGLPRKSAFKTFSRKQLSVFMWGLFAIWV